MGVGEDPHFLASHLELRINARNQMQSICNQNRGKTLKFTSFTGRDLGFSCAYKILLIPTRRTATSSKQIRLEDVILYVLKSSDSLWSTRSFDFRYQNIITENEFCVIKKQSICITVYTGLVVFLYYTTDFQKVQ